jgi:hypothetical protein
MHARDDDTLFSFFFLHQIEAEKNETRIALTCIFTIEL